MPSPQNPDLTSDFEKITAALSSVVAIGSPHDLFEAFGLTRLPTTHRYGILFGCVTFVCTITAVLALLFAGGSFERIREQGSSHESTIPDAVSARKGRPLLLEWLLEARDYMMGRYEKGEGLGRFTVLTTLLMTVAPSGSEPDLVDEDKEGKKKVEKRHIPAGYEENYRIAYRTCQDKPGVPILTGLPESCFEAYARAYAGCGTRTELAYRRSYARLYEAMACATHGSETKFTELFRTRPHDIIGRTCRLEPLEVDRHAETLFEITNGEAYLDNQAYDPDKVWGFLDYGPFKNKEEVAASPVFVRKEDEAAFAIVEIVTDRVLGIITVSADDPKNLTAQLNPPIVKPTTHGTVEQVEACFLLMDRLFANGYRRIQFAIDSMDGESKLLPGRLGFTQEGLLLKHKIIKEASRDSLVYGMLNSDWSKGARSVMFKKLHGPKAQTIDDANNAKEGEKDEWSRVLKEKKEQKEKEDQKEDKKDK